VFRHSFTTIVFEAINLKRSHGQNVRRSRHFKSLGRLTARAALKEFKAGDRVRLRLNPSTKKGRPSTPRFNGKVGVVKCRQGKAYVVGIKDGGKAKEILAGNAHLVVA